MTKTNVMKIVGTSILCVCVLVAVFCGVFYGTKAPSTTIDTTINPNDNVIISPSISVTNEVALAAAVNSDGSQTITATVDKADGADGSLDWSIAFSNPSSTWASGKTLSDYVTMTIADDTQSVTLTCLQPFGEQIIVSVQATYYQSATASATVDYIKRIESVSITGLNPSQSGSTSYENKLRVFEMSSTAQSNWVTYTVSYGVGTINGEMTVKSMTVDMGESMYQAAVSACGYTPGAATFNQKTNFVGTDTSTNDGGVYEVKVYVRNGFIYGGGDGRVFDKLVDWFGTNSAVPVGFSLNLQLSHNGRVLQNYTQASSGDFRFDNTGIDLVNSVSLEGQEVAF